MKKRVWELSAESLEKFLLYLDSDRNRAGAIYEQIRRKLITFFRCNGCWDAETLVDETLDRVIRRLDEGSDVRNLMPFIKGVAKIVAWETHKKDAHRPVISTETYEPTVEQEKLRQAVEKERQERELGLVVMEECAARLSPRDQFLAREYYRFEKQEKAPHKRQLANDLGFSADTLRVKAFRVRQRLLICWTERMKMLKEG